MMIHQRWSRELGVLLPIASGISLGAYLNGTFLKMIMPVPLFFTLYPAMLDVDLRQIKGAIGKPGLVLDALFMNFLFSPLLMVGLSRLLLSEQDKTLMIGLVLLFLLLLLAVSSLAGRLLSVTREDAVSLSMSTTLKNNAISMALAFSAFGAEVALVNAVTGPRVQLPFTLGYIRFRKRTHGGQPH